MPNRRSATSAGVVSGCEAGVFPLPFGDLRRHPEAVNADCDHNEQEPLDPQAKKAYSGASEQQLSALNERVLRPPLFHEDKAERVPDTRRDYRDQPTEQRRAVPR